MTVRRFSLVILTALGLLAGCTADVDTGSSTSGLRQLPALNIDVPAALGVVEGTPLADDLQIAFSPVEGIPLDVSEGALRGELPELGAFNEASPVVEGVQHERVGRVDIETVDGEGRTVMGVLIARGDFDAVAAELGERVYTDNFDVAEGVVPVYMVGCYGAPGESRVSEMGRVTKWTMDSRAYKTRVSVSATDVAGVHKISIEAFYHSSSGEAVGELSGSFLYAL